MSRFQEQKELLHGWRVLGYAVREEKGREIQDKGGKLEPYSKRSWGLIGIFAPREGKTIRVSSKGSCGFFVEDGLEKKTRIGKKWIYSQLFRRQNIQELRVT